MHRVLRSVLTKDLNAGCATLRCAARIGNVRMGALAAMRCVLTAPVSQDDRGAIRQCPSAQRGLSGCHPRRRLSRITSNFAIPAGPLKCC